MPLANKYRSRFGVTSAPLRLGVALSYVAASMGSGCSSDRDGDGALVTPMGGEPSSEGPEESELPLSPGAAGGGPFDPLGTGEGGGFFELADGAPDMDPTCADEFVPASARPPVIQFVVDTSGSMNWVAGTERTPEAGEQSKWQITQQALATAIDAMPDSVAVGITYYPNTDGDDDQCHEAVVAAPIAPLSPAHRALISRVNAAQSPAGGTPTHAAYDFGIEQLEASSIDGERFLVLMTDGIPTFTRECEGDGRARVDGAPLILEVGEQYRQSDIRSFVIGAPGSELAREELSAMALAGGTGPSGCSFAGPDSCHFDMTTAPDFSRALSQALGEISDATLACDYAVPPRPSRLPLDLNDVSVVLESGGATVGEFTPAVSGACESGWLYNDDRTSIRLCSSTCDELGALVSADPNIAVRIKFGCRVIPK